MSTVLRKLGVGSALVVAILLALQSSSSTQSLGFENQPPGYSRFAEYDATALPPAGPPGTCSGPGILAGCWFVYDPNSDASTQTVGDAPWSPSGVFQWYFPVGLQPGYGSALLQGWETESESNSTQYKEIYESGWIRVPTSDFEVQAVGVKFLGYIGVAQAGVSEPHQLYLSSFNPTGQNAPLTAVNISLVQQDNQDRRLNQNVVTDAVFTFGVWHHYEFVMKLNTLANPITCPPAGICADGVFEMWWNGTKIFDYSDITYRDPVYPSGFYARRFWPIWGGAGNINHSRDDYLQLDHIYISGKVCQGTPCS